MNHYHNLLRLILPNPVVYISVFKKQSRGFCYYFPYFPYLLYRVRQNKIPQRENRDIYIIQEYFYAEFSTFIHHICLHKSV